jgi:hypothetical protein
MKILCCYNGVAALKSKTRDSLVFYGGLNDRCTVDFVDVSGDPRKGGLTNYWHAIRERWTGEEDLVTIEQDNVVTAETLPSFEACENDWCCYAYGGPEWVPERSRRMIYSLGVTKFSASLQRQFPHERIAGDYLAYFLIDERLSTMFRMAGHMPHVHGDSEHLHDYEADYAPEERANAKNFHDLTWQDYPF